MAWVEFQRVQMSCTGINAATRVITPYLLRRVVREYSSIALLSRGISGLRARLGQEAYHWAQLFGAYGRDFCRTKLIPEAFNILGL